jgi:short-subunit dehydrogenase
MVHSFVPRMIAGGRPAHVVNVASVAAYAPRPGIAAYNISKAGVVALTESLVLDLLGVGADVGVSVVLPGKTATRLGRHILPTTADGEPAPAVAEADARSADDVAQQMVAAVERNQLYVFTHRERHAGVAARLNKVVAAFAGADLTPEELVLAEPDDVQRAIAQQLGTS